MRKLSFVEVDLVRRQLSFAADFEAALGFSPIDGAHIELAAGASRLWGLIDESEHERLRGVLDRVLQGQATGMTQFDVCLPNMPPRHIECLWSVHADGQGRPLKVVLACVDATQRSRTEQTLRESEARYRTALTAGRMGSWETDLVARTRTWSSEGMALFGLTLADGRGQVGGAHDEYLAALHPEDRHLMLELHRLADTQDSFAAEYRIVRPDGATLWLSGRGLVVARQADGKAHRLVSIMADVSERRQAEEGLRSERLRLAQALQAGRMGAFDLNLVDDVLWWSPQTYAVFGVDARHFEPTRDSVAALIHPEDRATFLRLRAEAIASRQPFLHQFRILRADGAVAWIDHVAQAEYDTSGRPIRNFGVSMDITERRQAEHALREADRKKDDFIATLAHELRNPLAPMRNAVDVLRSIDSGVAQIAWCRDVIERQVAQMARLLDDLLDVSRLTRGSFQLRRQPLDLADAIAQAVEMARPHIDQARQSLGVHWPAGPLVVHGDPMRLAQVFSNLLINASKFTPSGGHLGLAAQTVGPEVVVTVSDDGIGIDAQQLGRIFEMFGQVESALNRSRGGLGIGLSLAKGLVELHGGRIRAHSEGLGRGSEFVVHLPLGLPAHEPAFRAASADAQPARPGPLRILVADDLADSADSLAMLLQLDGHDVRVAYDGEQAVALAESFHPDVALLDLGMPRLNGLEASRRIRQQPWGRRMTLVAQTGWGQSADRQRSRDAGFDHHIVKPIDPDMLMKLLQQIGAA